MATTMRVQLLLNGEKLVSRVIDVSIVSKTDGVLCVHPFVGWEDDGPEPWVISAIRSGLKLPYEFSSQESATRAARRLWGLLSSDERRMLESDNPQTYGDLRTIADKWKNVAPKRR